MTYEDILRELRKLNVRVSDLEYFTNAKIVEIERRLCNLEQSEQADQLYDDATMLFRDYTSYIDSICYELQDELNKFKDGFHSVIIIGDNNESNIS